MASNKPPPSSSGASTHVPGKVMISGYPPYTQGQDLNRVFSNFGTVKIEKMTNKLATAVFSNDLEARAAIAASGQVNVYGQFLKVKPYDKNRDDAAKPQTPKQNFTRSKQKAQIIEPHQIELSGEFSSQLERVLAAVRLTQEDVAALGRLYADLQDALAALWPGCTAIPFGSITTGLGIKSSDADCFMDLPAEHRSNNLVNKAKRALQLQPRTFTEILSIPRANTPIVKFFHIPTQTNCDVTFKTPLGAQNSKLIGFLLYSDPRLIPLAVTIKYWAKVHDISGSGKLTNYALTMLIIFYLQQPPISILPSVEWLQREPALQVMVDHWNTGFISDRSSLPPSSNTSSISELLGGFFEYYSMFNFDEMVVCPYLGQPIKKEVFKDLDKLPTELERCRSNVRSGIVPPLRFTTSLCVQDPFEQCHNVASSVTSRLAQDLKAFFKFAANAYEKEKLNGCRDFLKTILLQKPKVVRGKTHPEYKVNLFPRMVNNIIDPEWKPIIRELILMIFEKMLKIKLGKVEEKVNPDSKKEKEKYIGAITKAIWKRKQFTKLYSVSKMGFQDKQEKITEEILLAEMQQINVQFQLTLTFCHTPRSAVVAIKMSSGDIDAFGEFGKFFITVTQGWFMELLKPYTQAPPNVSAAKIAETTEFIESPLNADEIISDDDDDVVVIQSQTFNMAMTEAAEANACAS